MGAPSESDIKATIKKRHALKEAKRKANIEKFYSDEAKKPPAVQPEIDLKTASSKSLATMKEISGPFDPFAHKRARFLESTDPMMQVCGWISRAWREVDAIEITGIDDVAWGKWKIEHPEELQSATRLGQALILSEIRGVALGTTTRRGQAASQKLLTEILGMRSFDDKSRAAKAGNDLDPSRLHSTMEEFETEALEKMAYGDDSDDTS